MLSSTAMWGQYLYAGVAGKRINQRPKVANEDLINCKKFNNCTSNLVSVIYPN
jgi:hypothetical protein